MAVNREVLIAQLKEMAKHCKEVGIDKIGCMKCYYTCICKEITFKSPENWDFEEVDG